LLSDCRYRNSQQGGQNEIRCTHDVPPNLYRESRLAAFGESRFANPNTLHETLH
jgi:hypothetical protein